ncbi:MAG: metallophosphoesterase [Chloroflexota bacterium]
MATAGNSTAPTGSPTARATPTGAPLAPATLIAAGDISSCSTSGDAATAALLDDLPGSIATLGDAVYPDGTRRQFADCYDPTWGRHQIRTRPAPGNHEYHTAGAAGYFGYFGAAAGDPATGYYAYDLGAWRIYSLNSNCTEIGGCGERSAEVAWLAEDLAAHPSACVLAYWHHPRYSSAEHGSQASTDVLWDTLYAAGAELVLSGHDHDYERFAPLSGGGQVDEAAGIVQFVVGTGGFSHYAFTREVTGSLVRNNTAFGVLVLTLSPGAWASRFVPIAGQSFTDEAAGTCH